MALRLLAYNTDTWLGDHLNAYLQDPSEYRAITRSLMHQPGTITYAPQQVTVTLDAHHTPRINRALALLLDEMNAAPARMPGDPRRGSLAVPCRWSARTRASSSWPRR